MADSQWVESQDWSHMLQTQAATEGQMQMQLETQAYNQADLWGSLQLETQAYSHADLWGSISIDSLEDQMDTQSYDADLAVENYAAEMETGAASQERRVKKTAIHCHHAEWCGDGDRNLCRNSRQSIVIIQRGCRSPPENP